MTKPRPNIPNVLRILSWSLYDLANQFFAINIITLYFVRWLVIEKNVPEIGYSLAFGISVLLVALLAPLLGFVCDLTRRPKTFLVIFTLICVAFTFALGFTEQVLVALLFFGIANFGCQMAVVFYNAMLVAIAPPGRIGLISGIGRMSGYLGAVVALYVINPLLFPHGYPTVFIGTAMVFLCFALPCMLFIKDRPSGEGIGTFFNRHHLLQTYRTLKASLLGTYRLAGMPEFLRAAFLGLAPVNVVILFMAVYAKAVFGLSETEITHLVALGTIFAVGGSILSGFISDFLGYRRSLSVVFVLWIAGFSLGALATSRAAYPWVGAVSGFALGSTFVLARAVAVQIAPPEKIGEAFGLFNLVGYLASVTGALFWGVILLLLSPLGVVRYRIALFSLNIFMLLGLFYLYKIPGKVNNHER